ncbi:MAG: M15 family metallopeptidase [Bacteroidota bacterium]
MIIFKHPAFIGKPCIIDEDFEHSLKLMGDIAEILGIKISVNSSVRYDTNVKGAIVEPAEMGNHLIAQAIDANLWEGKVFWTSKMLEAPTGNVLKFINNCKAIGLRWGGDFKKPDPIHFDSGLNIKNPKLWKEKYLLIQKSKKS